MTGDREYIENFMKDCTLCPRECHADRLSGQTGYCRQSAAIKAARAALHYWEEPCISSVKGSGAVFFSGCNMHCIFCQNRPIAMGEAGKCISEERLAEIFLELQAKEATNINLVTPTHYVPQIAVALKLAKSRGLTLPIVYNTSSYEKVSTLKLLDGLIDIYLPDLKYYSPEVSGAYSNAPDYFQIALSAIQEMYRQAGPVVIDSRSGIMQRGLIVRHLLLPDRTREAKKILRILHETFGDKIYISIMNQYTPLSSSPVHPELNRRVTQAEYRKVLSFADAIGITRGFIQEGETQSESFIPSFDLTGI